MDKPAIPPWVTIIAGALLSALPQLDPLLPPKYHALITAGLSSLITAFFSYYHLQQPPTKLTATNGNSQQH